ncbi:MAG: hypothetical protein LBT64_00125 [Puniceicoccales bacterium]|jgi:hypothetical protein|nr:hypothetical protein [Puniceicoccales bacterium]
MAKWIRIGISDLYDYMCAAQLNALKSMELAAGQTNPIDEIIGGVVARMRAEISGNGKNLLSADAEKIPQDLKSFACYLVLESAQTRLPSLKLSADQIRLASDAKEYLRRVSLGEIPISRADDAIPTVDFLKNIFCDVVHKRHRRVSQTALGGF